VANRIDKIERATSPEQWRHIYNYITIILRIFYKNNEMRITEITVNTKIKNLFTMTIESKTTY